jgi:hypothetical protein
MGFDDVGCPSSNFLYLLCAWWTTGEHDVSSLSYGKCRRAQRNTHSEQYKKVCNQCYTNLSWGEKAGISSRRIKYHLNEKKSRDDSKLKRSIIQAITTGPTGPELGLVTVGSSRFFVVPWHLHNVPWHLLHQFLSHQESMTATSCHRI